ncbi:uncharacterized protein LOC143637483 [Bidens hawaiensis]|uniref:uncharacterized protein LOC143637483 n=1 Tax=Bidens hawaiensis TaxID=980011 RepID=UPI004049AD8A
MAYFLFIIAMETLHVAMLKAHEIGLIQGLRLPKDGPALSHLFFADDVMFMADWWVSNFQNISRILRCFYLSSGLKVNFEKSKVYGVGVDALEVERLAAILNMNLI